ncbi:hypothetical protein KP509_23G045400 [Ceratopteris richardii]|uniref:Uncharacterized protein n=1 Tax=Ceratopteris richardii TaxID=49495 RepID=A0A8T2RZD4_CERRI|nr:hypothetical protein KP509_23G045400 [Ceratopteris richardii]
MTWCRPRGRLSVLLFSVEILFVHNVQSGCWQSFLKTLATMSRCYPYPPPGYEKKVHVESLLSPKKEKHKHKDKKKKKRRDKEANGNSRIPDTGKRPKIYHLTGDTEDKANLANGNLPSRQAPMPATVHENSVHFFQASRQGEAMRTGDIATFTIKVSELNRMVETAPQSLQGDIVSAASEMASTSSSESTMKRRVEFMPCPQKDWSEVDDQEWLHGHVNRLQICPQGAKDVSTQVWSDATFLSSVGIHALPYVILD